MIFFHNVTVRILLMDRKLQRHACMQAAVDVNGNFHRKKRG